MPLITTIDAYLKTTRTPPSRFGRTVARDPQLVFDMRRGRRPGSDMQRRIEAHLARAAQ